MEIINIKPNMNTGIWAENGDIVVPTSEKIEEGHIVEKPKSEIVNWIENRQDMMIQYINQRGIPEWDRLTPYPIKALTSRDGTLYRAISQNKDRDPTLNPDIWKLAFVTYDDYKLLLEDLDKIKNQDGYLDLYVSRAKPVMTGGTEGVSYGFTGDVDTGLMKDSGGNPAMQKDGVVVATFDSLEQENSVVRFADLRKYLEFYKVGDIYLTTSTGNPKDTLGYGTWSRYAEGRSLVGLSVQDSSPTWTKFVDSVEGVYNNTITFPMENWRPQSAQISTSIQGRLVIGTGNQEKQEILESLTQPIDNQSVTQTNVQPSIVIAVWKRVS